MPLIRSARRLALLALVLAGVRPLAAQSPSGDPRSSDPTAALLQDLIRANSSNPPGNERRVAEVLLSHFRALGIDAKIIPTPDSTKGVFVARLKGDGSKRPVLIAAHEDVVGVEREKWSVDPFAGVEKDGHIYGRGAVDFKGGMAVFARAVMMLAEQKIPLARDVIFLGEADEEGGGGYSTAWLAREHWDEIDAEFALNEGGWIMKAPDGHVRYVSVSTADKLSLPLKVTARGTSTHASMPRPDNAIFALSRAMAKISEYESPIVLTPEQRQFFLTLAKTSKPPMSTYYRDLVGNDPAKAKAADKVISKDPLMHSLMRNTIAATIINGGFRMNVIPGSAEATINLRMIPGSDPAQLIETLKKVVADTGIQLSLSTATYPRNAPSPTTTDLYRALEKSAKAVFPGVEVTPYLFQAGTDAGAWRSKGVPVYGIYPYPIDDDELSRMHGNDEKVSIASLKQGTEMIYKTLLEVAARR